MSNDHDRARAFAICSRWFIAIIAINTAAHVMLYLLRG